MEEPTVEEILNGPVISKLSLIKALAREFKLHVSETSAKAIELFVEDIWNKYAKLRPIFKEKDNLYDALMDEFQLPYE
ncbi:MAG TPA: hypothetical protein VIH52_02085 [Candidatus Nanoarchaeia archaeon]